MNHSGAFTDSTPSNLLNYEACGEKSASFFAIAKGFRPERARIPEFSRHHSARCFPLENGEENVTPVYLRGRHSSPKTRYIFLFVAAQYFRRSRENVYARRIPKGIAFLRPSANSAVSPGRYRVGFQFRFDAGEHETSTPSPNPGKEWEIERLVGRRGRVYAGSPDGIFPCSSIFREVGTTPCRPPFSFQKSQAERDFSWENENLAGRLYR